MSIHFNSIINLDRIEVILNQIATFASMDFLSLVFRLGVVLAFFSFIWGLIRFGLTILRGGLPLAYPIALSLKLVQYFLIADITILFCGTKADSSQLDLILSGLILLMYFLGKMQNMRSRFMILQFQNRGVQQPQQLNMNLELAVIVASLGLFVFLAIYPNYAENPASTWFYTNIIGIEKSPVFGFIFKIVGFFFTLKILIRLVSSFTLLLSGQAFNKPTDNNPQNPQDDPTHFDDYEELK